MKKILSNEYVSTSIGKFTSIFSTVITTAILNRYLGPNLRGEYAFVINQMILLTGFLNLGLPHIYHYFYRKSERYITIFKNLVFAQFILFMSIGIILQFSNFISKQIKILFLLIPIVVLAQQLNIMSLIHNINKRNKNNILVAAFTILIWIIIFLYKKQNIIYAYLAYALKEIILIVMSIKIIGINIKDFKIDIPEWKNMIKIAFVPMITMVLNTMNYRIDTIILGYSVDLYQLGLYSAALSIAEIAWIIPDIFKEIMFNKSAKNDSIETVCKLIKITLLVNIIMIIGIIIFGKIVILVLMGTDYIKAYNVAIILFLGIPSMSFFKIINPLYLANGNRVFAFKILLYSVIINILLNILLIPYYGIYGAAFSSVISYSVCGIIFLISFSRIYSIKMYDLIIIDKNDVYNTILLINKLKNKM